MEQDGDDGTVPLGERMSPIRSMLVHSGSISASRPTSRAA